MSEQVTIALPKGRLMDQATAFFEAAGIATPKKSGRQLILESDDERLRYIMARSSDVATYVEYGAADVGISGLEKLREGGRYVYEPLMLPFGKCRLSLCGPIDRPDVPLRYMSQPSVATTFPNLTTQFFRERGINAEIIPLHGSVELSPLVGLADLIVDIVETGSTLTANGLVEIETIMDIQPVLIVNRVAQHCKTEIIQEMITKLRDEMEKA